MNEKVASLLLIFLVALSIIYVCSSTALSIRLVHAKDAFPSRSGTLTEEARQNGKLSYPGPIPLGDPIDNPKPH